ncbi:class II histocompatibility antigen, M alpha chain-like isoform X3 [Protopterus annectens]|uniref:class II histocompatibility antigen, M alpha chain-like isoform X3 n=1 Tax=Protopterus annectens TaxID=7888 RepID=UPI001CF98F26|nr:class II histocompatibility antigen, M alpha chain-like isoform X3 [Protopterus annectens]
MESKWQGQLWCFCLLVLLTARSNAQHEYSQIMFCQPDEPGVAATEMFDGDEILSYNFSAGTFQARLPDFDEWAKEKSTAEYNTSMYQDSRFCKLVLKALSTLFIPKVKVDPVSRVYTRNPLEYGKRNTLICFVDRYFPPVISVSWYRNNTQITDGITFTDSYPTADYGYQMFSYLDFVPNYGDKYTCHIKHVSDYPFVEFWVPDQKPTSDHVITALCAVAFAIGISGIIAGIVFFILGMVKRKHILQV